MLEQTEPARAGDIVLAGDFVENNLRPRAAARTEFFVSAHVHQGRDQVSGVLLTLVDLAGGARSHEEM